jgi:glycosyltransferase involved in cell wall biosynthesis
LPRAKVAPRKKGQPYVFLHISDCDPRKGVDLLLTAFKRAFRRRDNVKLVIKGADYGHSLHIAEQVAELKATNCDLPDILYIQKTLTDDELWALYEISDCVVLPTRGEGLNLPAAEAIVAGKRLIVTAYSGHMDFVTERNARLVKFQLQPAAGRYETDGALWAEPDENDLVEALREMVGAPPLEVEQGQKLIEYFSVKKWLDRIIEATASVQHTLSKVFIQQSFFDKS